MKAITILLTIATLRNASAGTLRRKLEDKPRNCANFGSFCNQFADCIDLNDTFQCMCREGYVGDGRTCNDKDECSADVFPCPSRATGGFCVNTFVHGDTDSIYEGYRCGCDGTLGTDGPVSNVHGPTTCVDIDSCADSTRNNCAANAVCTNIPFGSFTCACMDGFEGDGTTSCTAISPTIPSAAPLPEETVQLCPSSELEILIATNDFETGVAIGWQNWEVDQTAQDTDFTAFLGSFDNSTTKFPYRDIKVPMSTMRVMIGFDFYEIDSWDGDGAGGPDTLGFEFYSEKEGVTTTANLGTFYYLNENESRTGNLGSLEWTITSTPIADSPQGFREFQDQKHFVKLEVGSDMYADIGDTLRATIQWSLAGDADENVGIDNFKVVACMDTVPSMMPSSAPTTSPSSNPTILSFDPRPQTPTGVDCGSLVFCSQCGGAAAACPFCQIECLDIGLN